MESLSIKLFFLEFCKNKAGPFCSVYVCANCKWPFTLNGLQAGMLVQSLPGKTEHLYYFCWRKTVGPNFLGSPTLSFVVEISLTYRFWLSNSKNCWTAEPTFDPFVVPTISGQQHFKAPWTVVETFDFYLQHQQFSSVELKVAPTNE